MAVVALAFLAWDLAYRQAVLSVSRDVQGCVGEDAFNDGSREPSKQCAHECCRLLDVGHRGSECPCYAHRVLVDVCSRIAASCKAHTAFNKRPNVPYRMVGHFKKALLRDAPVGLEPIRLQHGRTKNIQGIDTVTKHIAMF